MVARYWALTLQGKRSLPCKADAVRVSEQDAQMYKELFPLSGLSTLVDLYSYMDSMSSLIGCQPPIWWFVLTGQLKLLWKYLYGQHVPSWYRLYGPGSDYEHHVAVIRRLPVCLQPSNTVKHALANLVNSTGVMCAAERFTLMDWFGM